eukprot:scaffold11712_cov65-Skeletonema_menzelii.AAC.1
MIALAILVVAVRGSMVDEEEEEPAALGAMVVLVRLLFLVGAKRSEKATWQIRSNTSSHPVFPLVTTPNSYHAMFIIFEAYPISVPHLKLRRIMDWGQPAPFLPSFPPFLTGDKSPAGEISAGCLAVATVATRRSQRSQWSQPAGCDRCDRSDQGGRFVPAWR